MPKAILSINAGSSSVKVSAYEVDENDRRPEQIVEMQVAGLTAPPASFSYQSRSRSIKHQPLPDQVSSQEDAFRFLLDKLVDDAEGAQVIKRKEDIEVACHRVVHGGGYDREQIITAETYHHLEGLTELAPLHNAPALAIVRSCIRLLPETMNVACFDSAFHHTIPPHISAYPIDQAVARRNQLRKYGFHGISYAFIARSVAAHLGKAESETSIIALHLGSGASACAIKNGKSLDTSMGLTPLAGLPGATRSGSIDPSLVFHFASDVGKLSPSSTKDMHITTAEEILNKKSGWKALTGTTDFGKIVARATSSSTSSSASSSSLLHEDSDSFTEKCRLAFDVFVDRVLGYVGAYFVALDGQVDALVFAGGIGEKSAMLRARVVDKARCLGFDIDAAKNEDPKPGQGAATSGTGGSGSAGQSPVSASVNAIADISKDSHPRQGSREKRTLICWTDEQYEMARECSLNSSILRFP